MKVAVTDASIFIDLIHLDWIKHLPRLRCEIVTTYDIMAELHDWQQAILAEMAQKRGLTIHPVPEDAFDAWKGGVTVARQLSRPDLTVLWLAAQINAMVLTGDNLMRKTSQQLNLEVHGILWLFDRCLELELVSRQEACQRLEGLMEFNERLPRLECEKRLEKWNDQASRE